MGYTSHRFFSSIHLPGILKLPDDLDPVPTTAYRRLVRQRTLYVEAAAEVVK